MAARGCLVAVLCGGAFLPRARCLIPAYGQEWEGRREHCMRMRERLREIRYRMESAPPWERDRLGTRLYEIRERLRHECWGHWRENE